MTGSGTVDDPYIIEDVTDLQNMENDLTAYYELGGDIDASATSGWNEIVESDHQYEHHDSADSTHKVYGNNQATQTFTPSANHTIDKVRILAFAPGNPGTSYIDIYATDGAGKPTGSSIGSGSFNPDGWSATIPGTRTLGLNIQTADVIASTKYAIVISAPSGSSSNNISMRYDSAGSYASGEYGYSTDGGSTWTMDSDKDFFFSEHGDYYPGTYAGFVPISEFTGQLDGKGYKITDLFINRSTSRVGLFEINNGIVQKLGLEDCDITGERVGSIAAENNGTISKCYSTGAVTIVANGWGGGFVYYNTGTIQNCYSRCSVTGSGAPTVWAAGFVEYNDGGTVDDCYSTGLVSGETYGYGFGSGDAATNCFWDTETSGQATSDGGTGKTTAEMNMQSTFTDAGWDFSTPIWFISSSYNDGYPRLTGRAIYGSTHALARVSSIRHIYRPGSYRMYAGIGGMGLDIDVTEVSVRKELGTAAEVPPEELFPIPAPEQLKPRQPSISEPMGPIAGPIPTPAPHPREEPISERVARGLAADVVITCPLCGVRVAGTEWERHLRLMHPAQYWRMR